jgi:hypothetical protein
LEEIANDLLHTRLDSFQFADHPRSDLIQRRFAYT